MKLSHAVGFVAVSSCFWVGCAGTGSSRHVGIASMGGGSGALSSGAASADARGLAAERAGGMMSGAAGRDVPMREAASFSERDPQFAGPTPQVPIPHDGRQGQPASW